jgi:hypothetical protein
MTAVVVIMIVGITLGLLGNKLGWVHYTALFLTAVAITAYQLVGGGS